MAGYDGITAGYLIRGDRPCLVETGTAPSAPVVQAALARLGIAPAAGDLYVGDAAGVSPPAAGPLRPPPPPPAFARDPALASLRKSAALQPARLLSSHYGPVPPVAETRDGSAEETTVGVDPPRQ